MAASTFPAAKANLLTILKARPALSAVHVGWGVPADLPAESERIYVGDVRDFEREWMALGAKSLEESYAIEVVVEVFQYGNDQQAAEARLAVLIDEVEQAVRGDLGLGGAVRLATPSISRTRSGPSDEGWAAQAEMTVTCEARI